MSNRVIVVGGGLAGLTAAHSVLERGGSVLVLDKNPFLGGNSVKATSGINGAGTIAQEKAQVADTVGAFENDTSVSFHGGKSGQAVDPLVRVLTAQSGPAVEWLSTKFGIDLSIVGQLGGHSFPRTHRGKERFPGMTITYALLEKLESIASSDPSSASIVIGARVTKLLTDAAGAVVGVEYTKDKQTFSAEGPVILATGGFAADFESTGLLAKYRPDLLGFATTNGEHCTGDGIKLGESIGAGLVDMQRVQVHPTGLVHPEDPNAKVKFLAAEALRGTGAIMLNKRGERFCDELGRRDYVSGEMMKNEGPFTLVLNSASYQQIEWHCKHYQGRGLMKFAKSGEELAKLLNVAPAQLEQTFTAYNADAEKKTDRFGKKFFKSVPYRMNDTYYVAIIVPVVHYCMGGLKVNTNTEVLNGANSAAPIPGLFCAGEAAGGVHGVNRLGGNSLLDCVVYGRIAGSAASTYLLRSANTRVSVLRSQLETTSSTQSAPKKPIGEISPVQKSTLPSAIKPKPGTTESLDCGGTAGILPAERAKAS
eukprot:PhF_6_TR42691/c0_g1_i1/m.64419